MGKPVFTSPQDYLVSLRRQFPPRPTRSADILKDYIEPVVLEGISSEIQEDKDYGEWLFDLLRPRLPKSFAEFVDGKTVAIGEVNNPLPNAYLHPLDYGYAIIFNSGLADFIYRISRALSTRFQTPDVSVGKETFPFEETCRIIYEVFDWYIGSRRFTGTEQAAGPQYPISPQQFRIANQLAFEAEMFFLAHELGHLYLELSKKARIDLTPVGALLDDEESFADRFAFLTLLNVWNQSSDIPDYQPDLAYAGMELALQMFAALHDYSLSVYQVKFIGPHPDAKDRLANLRKWAKGGCTDEESFDSLTGFASTIGAVFSNIQRTIHSPEFEEYYTETSKHVINELHELLDRCTGRLVPDYMSFLSEVNSILEKGYPVPLIDKVARSVISDFKVWLDLPQETINELLPQYGGLAVQAHQKFKLLVRMALGLQAPYRSVWLDVLGIREDDTYT